MAHQNCGSHCDHKGGNLYMAYHQQKEQLAAKFKIGELSTLGIGEIP